MGERKILKAGKSQLVWKGTITVDCLGRTNIVNVSILAKEIGVKYSNKAEKTPPPRVAFKYGKAWAIIYMAVTASDSSSVTGVDAQKHPAT